MTSLTCPKCGSDMRAYERNRVLVDQCTGCGGLFLDRGEVEQLVAAENAWHAQPVPQQPYASAPQPYGDQRPNYDDRRGHSGGYPPRKRKKSFLSELFDD